MNEPNTAERPTSASSPSPWMYMSLICCVSHAVTAENSRTTAEEIRKLIGKVEQRGYTLVPLDLHYSKGRVKLAIGLAKGKKQYDKRDAERERDWQREQQRLMRRRA